MPHQIYVSDITYIGLQENFAYLSLITDAYSRKIVGFYLAEDLSADGCWQALTMAIADASSPILIHHSDRGTQYCCMDYVALLTKNNINISMTQSGDPLENALAERVNGILKDELLEEQYEDFNQARPGVALAVSIYNYQRPHSSIDMLTAAQAHLGKGALKRHWKNYYSCKKETVIMPGFLRHKQKGMIEKNPLQNQLLTDLCAHLAAIFLVGCSSAEPTPAFDCKTNIIECKSYLGFN